VKRFNQWGTWVSASVIGLGIVRKVEPPATKLLVLITGLWLVWLVCQFV